MPGPLYLFRRNVFVVATICCVILRVRVGTGVHYSSQLRGACVDLVQDVAQHLNNHPIRTMRDKQGSETFEHISTGHTVCFTSALAW